MTLTPVEEMGKRFGEVVPGLKAAAGAVGLESHRRMLRDHAQRVRDDYKIAAWAAGFEGKVADMPEDDMGDIIITGDLNFGGSTSAEQAIKALKGKVVDKTDTGAPDTPAAPTEPVASAGGASVSAGLPTWLKVGIAGASLLGAGGTGAIIGKLLLSAPQVIQQPANDTDTNAGLRFKTGG